MAILALLIFDFIGFSIKTRIKFLDNISSQIVGYILFFGLLQLFTTPFMLMDAPWIILKIICIVLIVILFGAALFLTLKNKKNYLKSFDKKKVVLLICVSVFFVLFSSITFNVYSKGGDGAYWMAMYNDTISTGMINSQVPGSGVMQPFFDPHFLSSNYVLISTIADVSNINPSIIAYSVISLLNIAFIVFAAFDVVNTILKKSRWEIKIFLAMVILCAIFFINYYFPLVFAPWMGNGFTKALVLVAIVLLYNISFKTSAILIKIGAIIIFSLAAFSFSSTTFFIVGGYYAVAIIADIVINKKIKRDVVIPLIIGMLVFVLLTLALVIKQQITSGGGILGRIAIESQQEPYNIFSLSNWKTYIKTFFFIQYPVSIVAGIILIANWKKLQEYSGLIFCGILLMFHWVLEAPIFEPLISKFITTGLLYNRFPDANFVVELVFLFLVIFVIVRETKANYFLTIIAVLATAFTLIYPGIKNENLEFLFSPKTFVERLQMNVKPFNYQIFDKELLEIAQSLAEIDNPHLIALPSDDLRAVIRAYDSNGELMMRREFPLVPSSEDEFVGWNFSDDFTQDSDAEQLNRCIYNEFYEYECDELAPIIIRRDGIDFLITYSDSKINDSLENLYPVFLKNSKYIIYKTS
ncbi:hypothetical protein FEZ08_11665 [Culicoidibacter larvae]|uniref:Uncharacterized protein n=2 Tax=Culicoidibacter larvae TaxID=2579976 RepID=A0A5R8Q6R5_9FIRM|nr:hypothetical protein FEZ08_11665 [Culicoidibacter larvae]